MMTIEIKINGKRIAHATARNMSDLADISDYKCDVVEHGRDGVTRCCAFYIDRHDRTSTAWALAADIARCAAEFIMTAKRKNEADA